MSGGWLSKLFGVRPTAEISPKQGIIQNSSISKIANEAKQSADASGAGIAGCTIIAKNQLAHARVLAQSFQKHHPGLPFFVLIADRVEEFFQPTEQPFQSIFLEQLQLPSGPQYIFQFSPLDLRKSVKPFFFDYLFTQRKVSRLVYLDPEIHLVGALDRVYNLLREHLLVLIPYVTATIPDDNRTPTEAEITQWGSFDEGFLALADSDEGRHFLALWRQRVQERTRRNGGGEMGLDQRWLELAPGLFPKVHILRDDGYDVAYWNLHARSVQARPGEITVNGHRACFFNFRGFDPEKPDSISQLQNRLTLERLGEGAEIFHQYRNRLLECGYDEIHTWPFGFDRFQNGAKIPFLARRLYRRLPKKLWDQFGDPFETTAPNSFFNWLNENVDGPLEGRPLITRLWNEIYQQRMDVQKVFLQPFDKDRKRFQQWIIEHGRREEQLDECFSAGLNTRCVETSKAVEPANEPAFGVNIAGYFASEKGVGEGVRSEIRALKASGIPFVLNNFTDPGSLNHDVAFANFSSGNPYATNLIHVNADAIPHFVSQRGMEYLQGHYNIGFWAWELSLFPRKWNDSFAFLQEIWAPSTFTQESISRVSPLPVVRIPHTLLPAPRLLKLQRQDFGLPSSKYLFLFTFDFHSYFERKNPLAVIRAFKKAFSSRDEVALVLKCSRPEFNPRCFLTMKEEAAGADIHILHQVLSREEVDTLMSLCDCYVSLHRSEGFGLTMAEAMALGKPVIATSYSGNMDFMNPANSFLVKYRLIELEADYGPYQKGSHWADADVDHAAEYMRLVFDRRDLAARVAERGQQDVRHQLAPATVGKMVQDRILTLAVEGRLPGGKTRPTSCAISTPAPELDATLTTEHTSGKPLCSVIIPVHNRAALTQQCLGTVLTSHYESVSVEVLVVDDASTDETPTLLQQYGEEVRVIRHATNKGFAHSCNDGSAAAKGEYLVFLNNDTLAHPGWLDALVRDAHEYSRAGVIGSKLLFLDDTIQHAGIVICQDRLPRHIYTGFPADHPAVNKARRFPAVTGACILIKRALFRDVGGFDTSFLNSHEDVDLCLRLAELGYEIRYCPESVLHHLESVSRGSASKQEEANTRLFLSRWGSRLVPNDLSYYAEDGLLGVEYVPLHPLKFRLAPHVGILADPQRQTELDRLLQIRTEQVLRLLKDNIRLQVEIDEAVFRDAIARADSLAYSDCNGALHWATESRESEA